MNDEKQYEEFYKARNLMQEIIRADLLGPNPNDPEEIIRVKYPTSYYIAGKLYPISKETQDVLLHDDAEELSEISNTDDKLIDENFMRNDIEENGADDEISGCNILNPSAMGITFAVKAETEEINVSLDCATYYKLSAENEDLQKLKNNEIKSVSESDLSDENKNSKYTEINAKYNDTHWKRKPMHFDFSFDLTKNKIPLQRIGVDKVGELVLLRHKSAKNEKDITRYTLSFKNTQIVETEKKDNEKRKNLKDESEKTIFQPRIEISISNNGYFNEVKRHLNINSIKKDDKNQPLVDEDLVMELLYSKVKSYAQGHGCAVSWDKENEKSDKIIRIKSEFLPQEQILQMRPVTSDDIKKDFKNTVEFDDNILNTEYLKSASKEEIKKGITNLCKVYYAWIKRQRSRILELEDKARFENVANHNLGLCEESLERIQKAAEIITKDDNVYNAFICANEAIFEQNRHKKWISKKKEAIKEGKRIPALESIESFKWYPFQLAFILQEIESIANPNSEDRNLVDLLWFPTGGGKTEAYLGLAAFTIFLRRLKHPKDNKGVSVLTRYTYRLLTFQQFERTLKLICACEEIRKNKKIPGEKISIGLWIGGNYTPNKIKDAYSQVNAQKKTEQEVKTGSNTTVNQDNRSENKSNPIQIRECPWCGEPINASDYTFDIQNAKNATKMYIHCPNEKCKFGKNNPDGIPAILIDEQIYIETPDFVIATVDKFAQIPLQGISGSIFGYMPDNKRLLPPDLIIQDELHLLTGPLGTITGIYEAGFKRLCKKDGCYPKVISSTATVKNAQSQIKSLYGDKYSQFPAQGLDIRDSFFAKESTEKEKPGRMYMGCMATGTTPITMMVRVMAILYFASRYLSVCKDEDGKQKFLPKVIDSFWTITGYFNTLRELGGAIIRITDDVSARFFNLITKYEKIYPGVRKRSIEEPKELTSRMSSTEIGMTLNQLSNSTYEDNSAAHFLLATNMISVGVDIERLGSMIVVGQPKMTAEYIQATSRVGRTNPGFVLTTYNQKKSRDRSHFEQFKQYHQSFYKFVEATSITPFSDRARSRALHTIYVMLCRYLIPALNPDNAPGEYSRRDDFKNTIKEIKGFILETVRNIDSKEVNNVEQELDEIDSNWYDIALHYKNLDKQTDGKVYKSFVYKKNEHPAIGDTDKDVLELFQPDIEEDERFRAMNSMRSVEKSAIARLDAEIYEDYKYDKR